MIQQKTNCVEYRRIPQRTPVVAKTCATEKKYWTPLGISNPRMVGDRWTPWACEAKSAAAMDVRTMAKLIQYECCCG